MLGGAVRALSNRARQLEDAERKAMGKPPLKREHEGENVRKKRN